MEALHVRLQNISDRGIQLVADNYQRLKKLDITRYD
jgi:hypothetical protein